LTDVQMDSLRSAVKDKNGHWFKRYRATSGNDVWGTRSIQDGNKKTLTRELEMLDTLTANRDKRIWALVQGKDLEIDDSNLPDRSEERRVGQECRGRREGEGATKKGEEQRSQGADDAH